MKIVYSKGCDVTNHQILYWIRCFGMYRRTGFAFKANSMQFLCNTVKYQIKYLMTSFIHSFIHSFIMHSVNPYKANQPTGYRGCHDTNII